MGTRIIHMSESYREQLICYMHKIYPTFSDTYIQYDVNEAIGNNNEESNSLLVLNKNNEIVGCHLNFNTKAWIYGKEEDVSWGHNTFLDKDYRKEIGLDFVLEIARIKNGFGHGLTKINTKIQHKLKYAVFISGVRKFCILNIWAVVGIIKKLLHIKCKDCKYLPATIKIQEDLFSLCKSVDDISIPNNGYWNKDYSDVDFIRDKFFLNNRFFNNPVHKYYIYTNKNNDCYFVVRPIVYKGFRAVVMADFRYMPNNEKVVMQIFKAAEKLCMELHAGAMLFTTNNETIKKIYENKLLCRHYPDIVTTGKQNARTDDARVIINAADSDEEFHK